MIPIMASKRMPVSAIELVEYIFERKDQLPSAILNHHLGLESSHMLIATKFERKSEKPNTTMGLLKMFWLKSR
jgi:hypothetical protein